MPITITKLKPAPVPVPILIVESAAIPEVSSLTDEMLADTYGDLEDEIAALMANPVFIRFSETKEELASRMLKFDPQDGIKIKGQHWQVEVGPCGKEPRKVTDPVAVMKFVGAEAFAQIAKVGITDAEKYLTPSQFVQVISTPGYTTNRKVKAKYLG